MPHDFFADGQFTFSFSNLSVSQLLTPTRPYLPQKRPFLVSLCLSLCHSLSLSFSQSFCDTYCLSIALSLSLWRTHAYYFPLSLSLTHTHTYLSLSLFRVFFSLSFFPRSSTLWLRRLFFLFSTFTIKGRTKLLPVLKSIRCVEQDERILKSIVTQMQFFCIWESKFFKKSSPVVKSECNKSLIIFIRLVWNILATKSTSKKSSLGQRV